MLNEKNLNLAGWLAVSGAVLAIPLAALGIFLVILDKESVLLLYLEALVDTVGTVVYVYIFVMFRRLLNEKANFHDVDKYISFLIWMNIVITAISVVTLPFETIQGLLGVALLVLMIPFGIVYVVFGIKLLNCEDDLYGYLKPLSYLTIATGVMTAVIVLILFGILTTLVAEVVLALIFFKGAKQIQKEGSLAGAKA